MMPYFSDNFFNPSANYDASYEIRDVINNSRMVIANTISCKPDEIYFTSCGSESDNWALSYVKPGQHIITSLIEHHAIINTCKKLELCGVEVTYLPVDQYGRIDLDELKSAIQSNTVLISVMAANNEIGVIQSIDEIGSVAHQHGILFHTDAVQYYGHYNINVNNSCIDMMSVSGHKFNGPKGIGFLYINNRVNISPFINGGGQQFGKRAGTENVPGIVGIAKAAKIAYSKDVISQHAHIDDMRNYLLNKIMNNISDCHLNGHPELRLFNNINVSFDGIRGEQLIVLLSMYGICASTGSACSSSSNEPSHVLKAIGLSDDGANSSIRFTLSNYNTFDELDYVVDVLKQCVADLRSVK